MHILYHSRFIITVGLCIISLIAISSCTKSTTDLPAINEPSDVDMSIDTTETQNQLIEDVEYFLPNIDLNNWKVTLPIGNPTEVEPPEILSYASNPILKDFMYNDSTDASLVFNTYPGSTTTNTSYSRTELREQMDPGSNTTNWTFAQGGSMKGTLKVDDISKDNAGNYHRVIIMQIHGRLTDSQRDDINEDDNNAPPVLKIYWNDNRVRVLRKVLKDVNTSYPDILKKESWTDEGFWFEENVGFEPFTLEIIVSNGIMKIILNEGEEMIFDDIHIDRWRIFENYFKAGNYLITTDNEAHSRIKYFSLETTH